MLISSFSFFFNIYEILLANNAKFSLNHVQENSKGQISLAFTACDLICSLPILPSPENTGVAPDP